VQEDADDPRGAVSQARIHAAVTAGHKRLKQTPRRSKAPPLPWRTRRATEPTAPRRDDCASSKPQVSRAAAQTLASMGSSSASSDRRARSHRAKARRAGARPLRLSAAPARAGSVAARWEWNASARSKRLGRRPTRAPSYPGVERSADHNGPRCHGPVTAHVIPSTGSSSNRARPKRLTNSVRPLGL
jgi:hypothetical protein